MSEQPPPARCGFASESPQIDALLDALASAQAKIGHAEKNANNPHFNKMYADLSAVIDASRSILAEHGLSVIQRPDVLPGVGPVLRTRLGHKSGQWIESVTLVLGDKSPQTYVAGITYAKRAGWASIVGVAPEGEDDDGETAEGRGKAKGSSGASEPERPAHAQPGPRAQGPSGDGQRPAQAQRQQAPATSPARGQRKPLPEDWCPRFGQLKGRPIGEGDDEQLGWLSKALWENFDDPDKARFQRQNKADAETVDEVIQRRKDQRLAARTGTHGPLDGTGWDAVLAKLDRDRPDASLDLGDDPGGLGGYDDRGEDPDAY